MGKQPFPRESVSRVSSRITAPVRPGECLPKRARKQRGKWIRDFFVITLALRAAAFLHLANPACRARHRDETSDCEPLAAAVGLCSEPRMVAARNDALCGHSVR